MVLSCTKEKYSKERFTNWENSLSKIANDIPIVYLFGKSEILPTIPQHKNVSMIIADCGDNYEDIPLKIYYGVQYLRNFSFKYIIKIDENLVINDPIAFIKLVNKEIYDSDYISLRAVFGNNTFKNTHLSTWHQMRTTDKRFMFLPSIVYEIPYASGPAYAISNKASQVVKKEYFMASLFEDYAMGYNLYNHKIFVSKSSIIGSDIIFDPAVDEIRSFPRLNVPIDTKPYMDAHIARLAYTRHKCYTYVFGGLGNQLFQIATGLSHAIQYEMDFQIIALPCNYNERSYYWDSILSKCKDYISTDAPTITYKYEDFKYIPIEYNEKDIVLWGYFQSAKYFQNIRHMMKYLVSFPSTSLQNITKKYGHIFTENHVVVHARRGDYLKSVDYHGILSDEYYINAMDKMKETVKDPIYIVISDDVDYWEKSTLISADKRIIFSESDITTLHLMMNSHNFIIANSTFSWWGAYLSQSNNVIAPAKWFGPKGPQDWHDIYPPEWTIL